MLFIVFKKNHRLKTLFIVLLLSLCFIPKVWAVDYSEYLEHLSHLQKSQEPQDINDAVVAVKMFQTVEAYEIINKRLEGLLDSQYLEPADLETKEQQKTIIIALIKAMASLGSQNDVPLFKELEHIVSMAIEDSDSILADSDILHYLEKTRKQLATKSNYKSYVKIEDLKGYISDGSLDRHLNMETHRITLDAVNRVYERMKKDVEEQDVILRSIAIMYLKDMINDGHRLAPEVFYFMGLPGNGRDTVVESFVNALHPLDQNAVDNHMHRMTIRSKSEAWSQFGSGKGYMGSDDLPKLLVFLVNHSAGRYILTEIEDSHGRKRTVIESNPKWSPGDVLGDTPDKAVVYIDALHGMPKLVKDSTLKQAIDHGFFEIKNPGQTENSVSSITVPVTFFAATSEGISLLEPREKNGTRIGKPLSYELLLENYQRVFNDKSALKQAILLNNGERNNPSLSEDAPGTSEEFLNIIPNHRVHLFRPLSPAALRRITEKAIARIQKDFASGKGKIGRYNITVSDDLIDFIVDYNYVASENARPIESRIESFISNQIFEAILNEKIRPHGTTQDIFIDLIKYNNGVHSVSFKVAVPDKASNYQFNRIIEETLSDRALRPLSHERILEIASMREEILRNAFGVEHIVDRLVEASIVSESEARNRGLTENKATVMAFLGKSSTGKTELAKQYIKVRYGKDEKPILIDFSEIDSIEALRFKILGKLDSRGNPIPSEFMKAYDRLNGRVGFIFDESANAPKHVLKALYEILREPVVTAFSDGEPRSMKEVSILLTGNAGEEIYNDIPVGLPSDVHERALHEVFKIFISNESLRHKVLLRTFTDAFLARLGPNIFHFGPLTHAGKRQVAQLKLLQGLEKLKGNSSETGWDILFKDEQTLFDIFSMIEKEGFDHNGQGASIDLFVSTSVIGKIKSRLLVEGIAKGQKVIVELVPGIIAKDSANHVSSYRQMNLITESGEKFALEIPLGQKNKSMKRNDVDRALTAYHEVGHEIVSEVYFGDRVRPKFMTILEGVTIINDIFVHYNGVRRGENAERVEMTKGAVLRRAAVLAGGYVAQSLVTLGGRHDSGKSNDIHRATNYIKTSILSYGLSEKWGMISIPENMSIEDYISKSLSNEEKSLLHKLTLEWLKDAEKMAVEALMLNAERLLLNMSLKLAERGNLNEDDILSLYKENEVITEYGTEGFNESLAEIRSVKERIDSALMQKAKAFKESYNESNFTLENAEEAYNFLTKSWRNFLTNSWNKLSRLQKFAAAIYLSSKVGYSSRDAKLSSQIWMPGEMANIEKIISNEYKNSTRPVTQLDDFRFMEKPEVIELPILSFVENVEVFQKPTEFKSKRKPHLKSDHLMPANSCMSYLN